MTFFCTQCGTALDDDMVFCTSCGSPVQNPDAPGPSDSGAGCSAHASNTIPMAAAMAQQAHPAGYAQQPAQNYAAQQPMIGQPMPQMQPVQQPQQKDNKPVIIAAIAAAAVIVIAVIVAFTVILNSGDGSSEVTFETGGGTSIASLQVDNGDTITSPAEPTRQGYTFDGWYLDKDFKQKVTFPYTIDKDTVLYAKWTEGGSSGATSAAGESATGGSNAGASNTVTLTCVGADGSTRTGTIHRQGNTGRVFPDSNTRLLSASEVAALSDAERCVAWNEIIAASNGYSFKNGGLRDYFTNNCSWYTPIPGASAGGSLSSEASANVSLLKSYTDNWWEHLATY